MNEHSFELRWLAEDPEAGVATSGTFDSEKKLRDHLKKLDQALHDTAWRRGVRQPGHGGIRHGDGEVVVFSDGGELGAIDAAIVRNHGVRRSDL